MLIKTIGNFKILNHYLNLLENQYDHAKSSRLLHPLTILVSSLTKRKGRLSVNKKEKDILARGRRIS